MDEKISYLFLMTDDNNVTTVLEKGSTSATLRFSLFQINLSEIDKYRVIFKLDDDNKNIFQRTYDLSPDITTVNHYNGHGDAIFTHTFDGLVLNDDQTYNFTVSLEKNDKELDADTTYFIVK